MQTIRTVLKLPDLRKRLLFIGLIFMLYKIGTYISVPGVDRSLVKAMTEQGGMFGFANMISGGALSQYSIFAVGIMPYITASIVIQLLSMDVVPILSEWSKQGEFGQRKQKILTRYMTVILALIQSFAMSYGFNKLNPGLIYNPSVGTYVLMTAILTLGTVILMVFAELIDKRGLGKGMSLIIFAGILMSLPSAVTMFLTSEFTSINDDLFLRVVKVVLILAAVLAIICFIIFMEKSARKIPIQYHKKSSNQRTIKSHLPIKINSAGVIPVIFAVSLLMAPQTLSQLAPMNSVSVFIQQYLTLESPTGIAFYSLLIIAFTFFYAFVQVNPEKMADNLQKNGGYVPSIRPGRSTQDYFSTVLARLTLTGSLYLAILAVLPIFIGSIAGLPQSVQIGGTSLIILVSVALDTLADIESRLTSRHYSGFMKTK